jgi:hypothetical protein
VNNGYITLTEFKASLDISSTDTTDDTYLEYTIERASRAVDEFTQRHFYPLVDTYEFDTPEDGDLWFWANDLLEVTSITNGEYGALSSTDYTLMPRNQSPASGVRLVPSSSIYWEADSNADSLNAISVAGWWGFRQHYTRRGWLSVGTSAVLDADTTIVVTTPENALAAGEIARIDSEMMYVVSSDTAGAVVTRGYNGSTAATHIATSTVKKWVVEPVVAQATLIQAGRYWKRKDAPFGVAGVGQLGQVVAITNLDPDVKQLLNALVRAV